MSQESSCTANEEELHYLSLIMSAGFFGTMITAYAPEYPFIYVCPNLLQFLNCNSKEFEQQYHSSMDLVYEQDKTQVCESLSNLITGQRCEIEYRMICPNGQVIWVLEKAQLMKDQITGKDLIIRTVIDISVRKTQNDQLLIASKTDPLTQIYNRRAAEYEINQALFCHRAKTYSALFLLDIDNFKQINDANGHIEGDLLLTRIAQKIKNCFREKDIVARLGGDEFVIYMKEARAQQDILEKAEFLCRVISDLSDDQRYISVSIGIAIIEDSTRSYAQLYDAADRAMYRAKCAGKNTFCLEE